MPIRIYNVNGICCALSPNPTTYEVFPLPAGVYLLQVGKIIQKIIV